MSFALRDIHLHLDGSIPMEIIPKLAEKAQIVLPKEHMEKLFTVGDHCTSLEEYLACFSHPTDLLQIEENLYLTTKTLVQNLYKEGHDLAEIRFAPQFQKKKGLAGEAIVEAVIGGMQDGLKEAPGMKAGILLCLMSFGPAKENEETVLLAKKYLGHGVIGIDRAGAENGYPIRDFAEYFKKASSLDIPYTIHAGECWDENQVQQAIDLGTKRIGHGVASIKSPKIVEQLIKKDILLEVCPISNRQTKAVPENEEYPIRRLWDMGVKICLNTDNRTVSSTNLQKEIDLVQDEFGFEDKEIMKMMEYAKAASFI